MKQSYCMKDLKVRIAERGVCTNVAIQQMLVAEHLQEIKKHRGEEATIDSTVQPSPAPIKILSSMRRKFSQHCGRQPSPSRLPPMLSLSTPSSPSTIPDEARFPTRALQQRRRSDFACLRPVDTTMEHQSSKQPHHHRTRSIDMLSHEKSSTNSSHQNSRFSLFHRFSTKRNQRPDNETIEHQSNKQPHNEISRSVSLPCLEKQSTNNANEQRRLLLFDLLHSKHSQQLDEASTENQSSSSNQSQHDGSRSADLLCHEEPSTSNTHQLSLFDHFPSKHSQHPADKTTEYKPIKRSQSLNVLKKSSEEERSTKNKHPPRRFPSSKNSKPPGEPTMENESSKQPHHEGSQSVNLFSQVEPSTGNKHQFSLV